MKKAAIYLFSLGLSATIFSSCNKQPLACLKPDKVEVAINETITFTNCSEDAVSAEWDFGDGATAEGNTTTHAYSIAGTYTVKIIAYSKKEKKKDETSMSITVKASGGNSSAPNTWIKKTDFAGEVRAYAVGFSIGNKGYIGTGDRLWNGPLKDFWEYDPAANTWTQKSDYGGGPRSYAVGFSIGSNGYIGTGTDENYSYTKDFWEYDPVVNTWTKKADFGGTARSKAVGFSIGNKSYIGTGYGSSIYNDFWEYDPANDTWLQKADFGGVARELAVGFSIGSKGYIGTGRNGNNTYQKDFWEYDAVNNLWVQKSDFGGNVIGAIDRMRAFGFSIGNKGYIGTGDRFTMDGTQQTFLDFWTYDPANDSWASKLPPNMTIDFARYGGVGFSIGNKGYMGTGVFGNTLKDFWEYTP